MTGAWGDGGQHDGKPLGRLAAVGWATVLVVFIAAFGAGVLALSLWILWMNR